MLHMAPKLSLLAEKNGLLSALEEALDRYGTPLISNTDQGAQFTCEAYLRPLLDRAARGSAWTARGAGSTTGSLSGCGVR